ncbi:MAG: hypothetical protein F9K32_09860 [Desulfobulbaceae bacterium]|nr:MAG: hypothetical protein F9K32_09860 [Desulfobulbaceae bacterium]
MIYHLLVVEDDPKRIDLFQSWLPAEFRANFVKSASLVPEILNLNRKEKRKQNMIAGICLDHDLQMQPAVAEDLDLSGTTVVMHIIRAVSPMVPVLIHSRNEKRARQMASRLKDRSFDVLRIPIDQMNKETFLDWLAEVKENWDDYIVE